MQTMLAFRDNGISFTNFVLKHRRRYILRGVFLVVVAALCLSSDSVGSVSGIFIAGMILGMVIQDFSWVQGLRNAWRLNSRITNWELVERIANGDDTTTENSAE